MAIYHLSVKTISRSDGRSATAAAAYRAGCEIVDQRTGEVHDYTRKGGVLSADLVLPVGAPEWAQDRGALWNAAEAAETRKNSTVAREFEVALPLELSAEERRYLAISFARELVDRHGFAADVCVHAPDEGENPHAHILVTTRRLSADGFAEKTRELDERASGMVTHWRERWAALQNSHLAEWGHAARVDHRSLEAQGVDRVPSWHRGPAVTGMARRGVVTDHQLRFDAAVADSEAAATALDQEIEALQQELDESVWQLEQDELVSGAAFERGLAAFVANQPQQAEPETFAPSLETLKAARRGTETAQDAPEAGEAGEAWQPSLETLKAAQKAVAKPEPAKPKPPEKDVADWDMEM